ncbi:MAG: hypothetical protein IPJ75_16030 [Ignavibacteriales bacterium]|nr:hypothetical protein [Ignavibacteriales bacterium]
MDCFGMARPDLLRQLDIYVKYRRIPIPSVESLLPRRKLNLKNKVIDGLDYLQQRRGALAEMKAFDYMVTRHPLQFYGGWVNDPSVTTASETPKRTEKCENGHFG